MFKFLFNLATDPLDLPIPILYEYIILLVLNEIAFKVAWKVSPGGFLGSIIHWVVRFVFLVFIVLMLNLMIILFKWIIANLAWFAFGIVLFGIGYFVKYNYDRKDSKNNV